MIHIMMDMNEHQDQRYNRGDNNGRDLCSLGVNDLVCNKNVLFKTKCSLVGHLYVCELALSRGHAKKK